MDSRKFRIKCALLSAIIIVFLSSTARADSLTDQVDKLFKTWDKPDSPGCALGVIKDGQFIYKRGYGMANLEYNIPLKPQFIKLSEAELKEKTGAFRNSETGTIWKISIQKERLEVYTFLYRFSISPVSQRKFLSIDAPMELEIEFEKKADDYSSQKRRKGALHA